ncbi:uncharacterized protein LOC119664650 [Teleopsis dalmanni]|uniref:uncharacterized protein LOC119664650 n=1 Tax=Teleopsis dalmanni TaxID=139649 RepID=UPI0018CD354D|nr:uncharacterized protein LOC119664650 [Teleopsis dalmanni]
MPNSMNPIACDVSTKRARPWVPQRHRQQVFRAIHNLGHPGSKSSIKQICERFVWPGMKKDITKMVKSCHPCQRTKVSRYNQTILGSFKLPEQRFSSLHIDIIGPLPMSNGFSYCLTGIDRFTRWAVAIPMADINASTVAATLLEGWIAHYGVPSEIITDQGRQFESKLFNEPTRLIGTKHKNDIKATPAEMVYGTTLRLPGEFIESPSKDMSNSEFVQSLRDVMEQLRPVPTANHSISKTFVQPDLNKCTHVYLRDDTIRLPLKAPYDGPFKVTDRDDKLMTILRKDKSVRVSIDRVKAAYLCDDEQETNQHQIARHACTHRKADENNQKQHTKKTQTSSSGRRIRLPVRFAENV